MSRPLREGLRLAHLEHLRARRLALRRRKLRGLCQAASGVVTLGALLALAFCARPAHASGNEHVVDDAAVETPGRCHLETWLSSGGPRQGLVNLAPACTRAAWPDLELGGAIQHGWADGHDDTLIGPAAKWVFQREETGLGLGLIGAAAWSPGTGRLETASLIVPATFNPTDRLRINLNAGWTYSRLGHGDAAFWGVQAEVRLSETVGLMVERFGHDRGLPGGQAGLRWTPAGGDLDLDLIAGRYVDGVTPTTVTLGLTRRF